VLVKIKKMGKLLVKAGKWMQGVWSKFVAWQNRLMDKIKIKK